MMCGELFAVLNTKLDEAPGINMVLNPEILGRILNVFYQKALQGRHHLKYRSNSG
jgi:hypothetical protein